MRRADSLRILLLISLLAAAPRLYVAAIRPLNYDEHWHVFIAQQDTRAGLAAEWRSNAHPPLYFWLLALPVSLGRAPLLDRSLSLLAGAAAVFVLGHIVLRTTSSPAAPLLGALAFALSPSAILISSEVRSYMLCTFFILLAFFHFLSLVQGQHSIRTALAFSVFSCLALMSHYFTVFFLLACLAAALYAFAVRALCGEALWRFGRDRWTSLAIAVLPILLTASWLYETHVRAWLRPQKHVRAFYYQPESGERLVDYLVSAVYNTVNLFSPVSLGRVATLPLFVGALALLAVSLVYFSRIRPRSRAMLRCLPLFFLLAIAAGLLLASLKGVYPFGGDLRQQFILLPLILIAASILLDAALSRLRVGAVLLLWLGVIGIGICLNSVLGLRQVHHPPEGRFSTMFAREMAAYRRTFPDAGAVYLDQFSLVVFFAHHDQRQWRSLDLGRYEVTKDAGRIVVLRDRARWNLDLLDERLYADIAARLQLAGLESTTVFSLRYPLPSEPMGPAEQRAFLEQVPLLAARHHVETRRLVLDGFNVFARFRRDTTGSSP